jgi:hypothetical protein
MARKLPVSIRARRSAVSICLLVCSFLTFSAALLDAPNPPPLPLRIAIEPAPASGWAQVQVFASSPVQLTAGGDSHNSGQHNLLP